MGRKGAINVLDDEITIYCGAKEVFRCNIADAQLGELMSLGGITINAADSITGKTRQIIAYYTKS